LIGASVLPLASGKMTKKERAARLQSLQSVYVDGDGWAASEIRKHLAEQTCLLVTQARSEADAILSIDEVGPGPCTGGVPGMCLSVSVQLIDSKTNEALWLTADDSMPMGVQIHPLQGHFGWVYDGLRKACCKDRATPAQPKDPNP
jgi:hypothetical protein